MSRPDCMRPDACTAAKPTSHCRSCVMMKINRNPEMQARKSARLREYLADPAVRARRSADGKARFAILMQDPDFAARRSEVGRKYGPRNLESTRSPASREKAGRAISDRKMAHIPPAYRDAYHFLTKSKGLTKAEATAAILADVERDRTAAEAAATAARIAAAEETRQRMMRGGGRRIVTQPLRDVA